MRKEVIIALILNLSLVISGNVFAGGMFSDRVDKAEEFMKAGMFTDAVTKLKQEIEESPANANAHFQLGVCYIHQNQYRKAEQRFSSAVRINSEYAHKAGKAFAQAGFTNLEEGRPRKAYRAFSYAIEHKPENEKTQLKQKVAQRFFDGGKRLLQADKYSGADAYFSLASRYDASLQKKAAELFYSRSEKVPLEQSLDPLYLAHQYDDKYNRKFGLRLLELIGQCDSSSQKEKYINKAESYVSQKEIVEANSEYYSQKMGEPQKLELSPGKWKEGPRVYEGSKFHYLSNKEFYAKGTNRPESDKAKWEKAISEEYWYKFKPGSIKPSDSGILEFKAVRPGTVLIYWVEH